MNCSLNYIVNKLLIFIFITFPFWEVISAQFTYFLHIPVVILGIFKYAIVIIVIFLLFISLMKKKFIIASNSIFIFIYVLYVGLHIIGSSHFMLKIDGLRYEFLFLLLAFLLFTQDLFKIININFLIKIIFIQGFLITFVALYEYVNQDILITLYRKSLDEIPHITWFSMNRLISTVGNPINLGASLIIWIASYLYIIYYYKYKFLKYIFVIILLVIFFLISMTLSRTSLLAYILVLCVSLLLGVNNVRTRFFILSILGILTIVSISYIIQTINIDLLLQRFGNLGDTSEYTENARVKNWYYALSTFESIEYLWGKGLGASTPNGEYVELYGGLSVESSFISIFVNYGILGFLLFSVIFIRFFIISIFILKINKSLGLFFLLFLLIFGIFSLANDYNRNLPYVLYFWIFYYYAEINYKYFRKEF